MLKIWLITIGEPIPSDYSNVRLHRSGIIVDYLIARGHHVAWWNSAFNHQQKKLRVKKTTILKYNNNKKIILLYGGGYKKNISIKRIRDHYNVAREFKCLSTKLPKPDIIVVSFPPINLCKEAVSFAKRNTIPVIIDYRDLWPEAFTNILPRIIRYFGCIIEMLFNLEVKRIFEQATGIIGITEPFLKIALRKINREKSAFDAVFQMGYPKYFNSPESLTEALKYWELNGVNKSFDGLRICLFANISKNNLNVKDIIEASNILRKLNVNVQFVVCGIGDGLKKYIKLARKNENIIFPGLVNSIQIITLMALSDIGIIPYPPTKDFNNSLPNKVIEYFSGGLPIITSLPGYLGTIIKEKKCGLTYENNKPQDLANKIYYIHSNREKLKEMSENARTIYESEMNADLIYNGYVDFIENVVVKSYKKIGSS